ncbi:hypothetical protein BDZ94DRAFT_1302461 [Collybia nuda]|uniref:DUF6830 domain-containing protein n=1 Tax=Collybia nuda TaxID=64659 RepID=A0A9P6C8S9_9AGAR|nr:hypothetical protein BDZ94DRAFT_1302461 [Collybia nuda]
MGNTALHLSRDPAMKLSVDCAMETFKLPDLCAALTDFITRFKDNDSLTIGGRRVARVDAQLPFDDIQIWTKLQLQNCSYHAPHNVLPPQTINVLPPLDSWTFGRSDTVLINSDRSKIWPMSGMEGHYIAQLCLIFCVLPPSKQKHTDHLSGLFLAYAQRFDIVPQPSLNYGQTLGQKTSAIELSTGQKIHPILQYFNFWKPCSQQTNTRYFHFKMIKNGDHAGSSLFGNKLGKRQRLSTKPLLQSYSFSTKWRLRLLRPFKKTQPDTPGLRPTNKKATSLPIRGAHAHENTLTSVDNTSTFFSARLRWTKGQGECGEMRLEGRSVKDSTTTIRLPWQTKLVEKFPMAQYFNKEFKFLTKPDNFAADIHPTFKVFIPWLVKLSTISKRFYGKFIMEIEYEQLQEVVGARRANGTRYVY